MKRATKRADEVDAVEVRHHLVWRRGEIAAIKRRMRRRERHEARQQLRGTEG